MKNTLLSALLVPASLTLATAQSTLTATNNNPVYGDVFYGHYCDSAGVTAGASGAHVTWNFASLTASTTDTTTFMACDSTPYCSSFSGSNLAQLSAGDYTYSNASSSKLSILGLYSSAFSMPITFSNQLDVMRYPFTYNSTFVDTGVMSIAGIITITEIDSYICDGYGTLTLPSGTDTNALRIHVIKHSTEVGMSATTHSRTEDYLWYKPGFHNILLAVTYDTAGSGTRYVSEVVYRTKKANSSMAVNNIAAATDLKLYPNPATEVLHVSFSNGATGISITDLTGRTAITINGAALKDRNEISIPVQNLQAGIYLVQVHTEDGAVITRKFSVIQ